MLFFLVCTIRYHYQMFAISKWPIKFKPISFLFILFLFKFCSRFIKSITVVCMSIALSFSLSPSLVHSHSDDNNGIYVIFSPDFLSIFSQKNSNPCNCYHRKEAKKKLESGSEIK